MLFKKIWPLLLVIGVVGCETISNEPVFDLAPKIELMEISQDTVIQFVESITLKVYYEDGDGDLGNSDPDINSLFVKDARLEQADEYYLAPLAPAGEEISIQGTLNIELSPTFLLGNGTQETTVLSLYLVDRSGKQSNIIETGEITILKN